MPSDATTQQFGRVVCIQIDFRGTAVIHHAIYEANGVNDNMSVMFMSIGIPCAVGFVAVAAACVLGAVGA